MRARLHILAFASTPALALLSPRTARADAGIPGEAIIGASCWSAWPASRA